MNVCIHGLSVMCPYLTARSGCVSLGCNARMLIGHDINMIACIVHPDHPAINTTRHARHTTNRSS